MSYQQPEDRVPYGYEPPVRQRTEMPTYNLGAPMPQPQPMVVNVTQQNVGPAGLVVRRRPVNHWLHFWLTVLTAGL